MQVIKADEPFIKSDPKVMKQLMEIGKKFIKQNELVQEQLRKDQRPFGLVPMSDVLQPLKSGDAWVEHFSFSSVDSLWHNIRCANEGTPQYAMAPGKYCKLIVDGRVMMSDVAMEITTNSEIIRRARGRTLIAGLGMGMILIPILRNQKVKSVVVVERNQDVFKIVYHQLVSYLGPKISSKLSVAQMDILNYEPEGNKFDTIYFDIWPTVSSNNWPEMKILESKFRKHLKARGWMSSWKRDHCQARWRSIQRLKRQATAAVGGDPMQDLAGSIAGFVLDAHEQESERRRGTFKPPPGIQEIR